MQMAFFFDQSRCSGCLACVTSCQSWHATSDKLINWRRVFIFEQGTYPDVKVSFLSLSCCHCAHPACLEICPTGAITKNEENGVVTVDASKCLGKEKCGQCQVVCPYDAPQFGSEADAVMQKCDFCQERLSEGKKPICVMACPLEALDFGLVSQLESKYKGAAKTAEGFADNSQLAPSILFKPK
ncbi:MAG: 4Fe-4S dicluster domain-containing protein [Chloroflexota bacterium]